MSMHASRFRRSFRRLGLLTQAALLLALPACAEAPDAEVLGTDDQGVTVFPGTVAVSGEVALGTPTPGPAAGLQGRPAIAWNGDHYLLVWQDDRRGTTDIWAARLNADGSFIDPTGKLLIENASEPAIATNGTDFLVTFGRSTGNPYGKSLSAARVSAAGALVSETPIPGAGTMLEKPARVAFDGTNYVVVWTGGSAYYARVSPQGAVVGAANTVLREAHQVDIAFDGTNTLIVTAGVEGIHGFRLSPQGNLLGGTPLDIALRASQYYGFGGVGVACTSGVCTVAWTSIESQFINWSFQYDQRLSAKRVTSAGAILDAQSITLWSGTPYDYGDPDDVSVGIDGQDAVIVTDSWHTGEYGRLALATVMAARLSAQGLPVGSARILASPAASPGIHSAIASNGPNALVVWADQADDLGIRQNHDIKGVFLDANGPVGAPITVQSASAQRHPSVTYDGENFVVAWSDSRNGHQGRPFDIYATRVSQSAQVLDPQGVLLTSSTFFNDYGDAYFNQRPRVGFDGEKAVVGYLNCNGSGWENSCVTAVSRLSRAGVALDATPLDPQMSHDIAPNGANSPPLLSGDGEVLIVEPSVLATSHIHQSGQVTRDFDIEDELWWPYIVAANGVTTSASSGSEHLYLHVTHGGQVQGIRLALDGTPLDGGARFPITPPGSQAASVAATYDGEDYVVVWLDWAGPAPRILTSRVTTTGTVVDTTPVVIATHAGCNDVGLNVQGAVHSGSRTLVAWKACGPNGADLFGAALDGDLTVAPFTLTADGFADDAPALAAAGPHLLATYSSNRWNTPLGAERVYARLLADVPPISVSCSMQGGIPVGSTAPLVGLGLLALLGVKRRRAR
ncbi:hypothetical protein [Chondromyces crocatus]|uniref:Uncharacterized protein n=1 Tax=Chondromyces crocatus TaxID=52 RepID=A0A0K1EPX0_CHOCO|nr:hypothetical protein [Chondromyces crocatus]AKT42692.1 uncharacterized protein CMC5_069190 [Chondromyces crocatus]